MYIIIRLLYNNSIPDIEHSPNYIALRSPQTHKMNQCQSTLLQYISISISILRERFREWGSKSIRSEYAHREVQTHIYF